ncbi:MAG TPA: hypothetical protein VF814_10280 [Casimicrobiaceae bacterium]
MTRSVEPLPSALAVAMRLLSIDPASWAADSTTRRPASPAPLPAVQ